MSLGLTSVQALGGGAGANVSLDHLVGNSRLTEAQKVAEACCHFEALLLRQILGEARKPVFESKLTEKSAVSAIYDDMVTGQLADAVSRSGEFGLARSLASQLTVRNGSDPGAATEGGAVSGKPPGHGG